MAHRSTHQQLDERLEAVEAQLADMADTLASIAGQLLSAAPDKPKTARKAPAKKA